VLCYIWGSVDWENWDQHKMTLQFPTPFGALNDMKLAIKQVSCGAKHTMIVTEDGKVYGFGNNLKGQLGLDVQYAYSPQPIMAGKTLFAEVACGLAHTVLRTVDGKVYSFGANVFGQLGHTPKSKASVATPSRVLGEIEFVKITQIAAGADTSYALAEDGSLYAWGAIQYGALGTGTTGEHIEKSGRVLYDDAEKPVRVSWFNTNKVVIQKVAVGARHVLVLTQDKKLYTFGHGAYGRLGQGTDAHDKLLPVPITIQSRREIELLDVACGLEHSLCLARMGQHTFVYFWGRAGNDHDGVMVPTSMDNICGQGVCGLAGGRGMSMVWTEAGEAAIWGDNAPCSNLGLLGMQKHKRTEPKVLELLADKHVTSVACGSWHMLVLVDPARSKGDPTIKVPKEGRELKAGGFANVGPKTPWEEVVVQFDAKCAGVPPPIGTTEPEEAEAAAEPPGKKQKTDAKPKAKAKPTPKASKPAASANAPMKAGTKLKAWFEDAYVTGTIKKKGKGKDKYVVAWEQEGWKDEEVELAPENHTTDESNPDRWQLL